MRIPVEMERKMKPQQVIAYAVQHLPIIKEFALKPGIVEIINEMIPSKMAEDPGTIFLALILDTLSGRSPLYRLEEFYEHQDTELLLGKYVKPEAFKYCSIARVPDKAYEIGTIRIFSEISKQALFRFDINTAHAGFDTASKSLAGDYELYSGESSEPFRITNGHSKDRRPDLKQFMISMLCVDKNIPVIGKTEDGNASDKTVSNRVLSSVSRYMAKYGISEKAYICIADSAMVTKNNLKQIGDSIYFISRLPAACKECSRAVKEAVDKDNWKDIGVPAVTKPTKKRPAAHYRVHETQVNLYGKNYRAIAVHSSAHDKRRKKRIDRELANDRKDMESRLADLSKKEFFCFRDA